MELGSLKRNSASALAIAPLLGPWRQMANGVNGINDLLASVHDPFGY